MTPEVRVDAVRPVDGDVDDFWRTILDELPSGIFILDANGHPWYANRAAAELLGKGAISEAGASDLAEVYQTYISGTDIEYPTERMPIVRALAGESAHAGDLEVRVGGVKKNLEVCASPILNSDGTVRYAVASFIDVSDRVSLEAKLRQEILLVRLLQEVSAAANSAEALDAVLRAAVTKICELTEWPLGHVWMFRDNELTSAGIWNDGAGRFQAFMKRSERLRLRVGEGLPGMVVASGQPAAISDIRTHPSFIRIDDVLGLRSAFAFPVVSRRGATAVLEFFSEKLEELDPAFLRIVAHVGEQLGHLIDRKSAEAELAVTAERYRDLFDNTLDLIWTHDLHGVIFSANRAASSSLGYSAPEEIIGKHVTDFVTEDVREQYPRYIEQLMTTGRAEGTIKVLTRDGHERILEYRNTLKSTPGEFLVRSVSRDVTEQRLALRALEVSEERYRLLFERSVAGVFLTTVGGRIVAVNSAFIEMFGYGSHEEMLALDAEKLYATSVSRRPYLARLQEQGSLTNTEMKLRRKDGSEFWGLLNVSLVDEFLGGEQLLEGTLLDITARKEQEERTAHQATHDALTGLPNRFVLMERLRLEIARCTRLGAAAAVCYVDLDRFKPVNDRLGHEAGDRLLIEVAKRLRATVRETDLVVRLGGDEFVVVLSEIAPDEALGIARKLIESMASPHLIEGRRIETGASIGIAIHPHDAGDPDTLLRKADSALYAAKSRGRGCVVMAHEIRKSRRPQVSP